MRYKMTTLSPGISRADVVNKLGRPDGVKRQGDYESLGYSHRMISGWSNDRADFQVVLKDGKVIEYGMGEVRVKDNNVLFLVPLTGGR